MISYFGTLYAIKNTLCQMENPYRFYIFDYFSFKNEMELEMWRVKFVLEAL